MTATADRAAAQVTVIRAGEGTAETMQTAGFFRTELGAQPAEEGRSGGGIGGGRTPGGRGAGGCGLGGCARRREASPGGTTMATTTRTSCGSAGARVWTLGRAGVS